MLGSVTWARIAETDVGEHPPDEEWARRLASGDEAALAEIYDAYGGLVHGLALRITRSRELAEDVTQEVFGFLWERPMAFDPARGSLRGWLGLLAHRRSVEAVRHEERRRRPSAPDEELAPGVDETVTEALHREELRRRTAAAVARLPDHLRQLVELAYYKGRTYRQVAEDTGCAEGTVKSRIRAALKRIATELAEQEVDR